jgi:hypothetical protein
MARRRPLTFKAWLIGLFGTILICIVGYYGRIYAIEHIIKSQLEHSEAVMQRFHRQQAERTAAANAAKQEALRQRLQQDAYDAQVAKARSESEQRRQAAWNSYYKPMRGCDAWQSNSEMVECVNHQIRARREFDQKWASGELDVPQG